MELLVNIVRYCFKERDKPSVRAIALSASQREQNEIIEDVIFKAYESVPEA